MPRRLIFVFLISFLASSVGCVLGPVFRRPAPAITTQLPTPTATLRPPPTSTLAPSPSATLAPTLVPTSSATPTPLDDFSGARLISVGWSPTWDFRLTFALEAPLKGEYKLRVGNDSGGSSVFREFSCQSLPEYQHPDWLYCSGRPPAVEKKVEYMLIDKGLENVVFKGQVFIPLF